MSFRIVVIGCGYITRASHGPAYRRYAELHPGVELAACCDPDTNRAEQVRAEYGFKRSYSDYHQMLAEESPDVVCLNVPVTLTATLSREILKMGLPLLAEKPPALSVAEMDGLIETAYRTSTLHQVAFNRRFAPLVSTLKGWLRDQRILHIDHTFTRVARTDPDFSTTAVHGIDTLRWLTGQDYGILAFQYHQMQYGKDSATSFIVDGTFTGGASVHMIFQPLSGAVCERTVIYCPEVTYELFLSNGMDVPGRLTEYFRGQVARQVTGPEISGGAEDDLLSGFYAEDAAFFDAVQAHHQSEHGFYLARQSIEVMQYLRERKEKFP